MLNANWDSDRAIAALRGMGHRSANLEPAMKNIGEYYVGVIDDRFKGEHDGRGQPWEALNAAYALQKSRSRTAILKILQRSGGLRQGISYKVISRTSVRIGSDKAYAKYHEMGWGQKQRSFMEPNSRDRQEFGQIVVDHIRGNS
jgi:phage gpG-like protein